MKPIQVPKTLIPDLVKQFNRDGKVVIVVPVEPQPFYADVTGEDIPNLCWEKPGYKATAFWEKSCLKKALLSYSPHQPDTKVYVQEEWINGCDLQSWKPKHIFNPQLVTSIPIEILKSDGLVTILPPERMPPKISRLKGTIKSIEVMQIKDAPEDCLEYTKINEYGTVIHRTLIDNIKTTPEPDVKEAIEVLNEVYPNLWPDGWIYLIEVKK